ncbi:hypothetical protein SAMN05421748_106191 [Paractinoplanes atraurantiacus]|uniref:Uncharacterized protein n=1 Tax=Paractinoplanes atraurantiacus TaxID=1036182 RepID=A0A285I192_9ACTN|nr:hypothetical protein SAMN05421748_106191 [Actinoplanes atraurantiacus]
MFAGLSAGKFGSFAPPVPDLRKIARIATFRR